MANIPTSHPTSTDSGKGKYLVPFLMVTSLFFLWGVANSLNGTLIRHFQYALDLELYQAGLVDSAFYIGYFVMALPAGFILNKVGYKKGIIIGLVLYCIGAALFYPSAEYRVYGYFLTSLFILACGLAFLETAANPYVTVLGPPAGAARRINLSQSFNGLGAVCGPIIGSLFIFSSVEYTNDMINAMPAAEALKIRIAESQSVQLPYLVLAGVVLALAIGFAFIKMPEISSGEDSQASLKGITQHKHLMIGVLAQFCYVGAQTSIWGFIVNLKLHYAPTNHLTIVEWLYSISDSMTPTQIASYHASFGFVMFMLGRFVGTALLVRFAANKLLMVYSAVCVALLAYAIVGTGLPVVAALLCMYFFMSIMFPTIFSLSIANLGNKVKLGSSLLIMSIVGGAIVPPLFGFVYRISIQEALLLPVVAFVVIFYFGWKGYKPSNA